MPAVHPRIFAEFDAICRERGAAGDVLEIGVASVEDALLRLPALDGARSRIGVDLDPPEEPLELAILRADAHDLADFAAQSFDVVLSNSVLEHDARFWLSLAEIRRVARPGALIVLGVPGFAKLPLEPVVGRLSRLPGLGRLLGGLAASTLTLQRHLHPADYYRFSPEAVREVFLEGLESVEVRTVMLPPRIIGVGVTPRGRSGSAADRER